MPESRLGDGRTRQKTWGRGRRKGGGSERRRQAEQAGRLAETLCIWLLRAKGYRILAQDLRVAVGEIDIIARRGGVLSIIGVKRRADIETAAEAITLRQRRRIARAAAAYVARAPRLAGLTLRFDVMLVAPARIPRHIKDAWRPDRA